jgi:hypothetical protein
MASPIYPPAFNFPKFIYDRHMGVVAATGERTQGAQEKNPYLTGYFNEKFSLERALMQAIRYRKATTRYSSISGAASVCLLQFSGHIAARRNGASSARSLAVDPELCGGGAYCPEGLGRAHSRVLQPGVAAFPGADWVGIFASASSARSAIFIFKELARTVAAAYSALPSAFGSAPSAFASASPVYRPHTVRRGKAAKPLALLDFGAAADDADGADAKFPAYSGGELSVAVMRIERFLA